MLVEAVTATGMLGGLGVAARGREESGSGTPTPVAPPPPHLSNTFSCPMLGIATFADELLDQEKVTSNVPLRPDHIVQMEWVEMKGEKGIANPRLPRE